jgi:hypothetical protein
LYFALLYHCTWLVLLRELVLVWVFVVYPSMFTFLLLLTFFPPLAGGLLVSHRALECVLVPRWLGRLSAVARGSVWSLWFLPHARALSVPDFVNLSSTEIYLLYLCVFFALCVNSLIFVIFLSYGSLVRVCMCVLPLSHIFVGGRRFFYFSQ